MIQETGHFGFEYFLPGRNTTSQSIGEQTFVESSGLTARGDPDQRSLIRAKPTDAFVIAGLDPAIQLECSMDSGLAGTSCPCPE